MTSERDLDAWLAAYRSSAGSASVRRNRLLSAASVAHANAVCRAGVAAHELDAGGPEARLRAHGIAARVVGEAVARARSLPDALAGLTDSPSHALALRDTRFTDVGWGVARSPDGSVCVSALLAAWPRPVPVR